MPVTFGPSGTPNAVTVNLDAVFAASLANYQKTLIDNITKTNAIFYELKKRGLWDTVDGGAYIQIPLLYGLATPDSYSGYDVLSTDPTDGITSAIYDWAQGAVPVAISGLEEMRNRQQIVGLVKAKIMQSEMGIQEWFAKCFLQGSLVSGGSSLTSPYVSPNNGSSFINPLGALIYYDSSASAGTVTQPSASHTIGGINQSSATWWRNNNLVSNATTYLGFLLEFDKMYDTCSKGPGGEPDIIWVDQITKELLRAAYYQKFFAQMPSDNDYPFRNVLFNNAKVIWDEFIPDVHSATASTATYGTAWFINTKFMAVKADSQTNFVSGKFNTPINQDARVKQILWAGQSCVSNRRKFGVIGKLARTLS